MALNVDLAIQGWASRATPEELDAGPSLSDLGGVTAVLQEATEFAISPQLPYLLTALARDLGTLSEDIAAPLLAAAAYGLREPHSGWVLADALDVLCVHPELIARLGAPFTKGLATLAEEALAGEASAALAQPAIAGLLRLAIAGHTPPHRLLALLADITGAEPADALERLPILLGVARDHFGEEALLTVLNLLENQTDLPLATRADASFELGLADAHAAFEATDSPTVDEQLRRALMRFKELDHSHEARLDARAHAAAIEAVLTFADLGKTPEQTAADSLADAARRLSTTAAHLTAWTSNMHQLDWLSARGLTQSAWSRLVTTLQTAQLHLGQPSWYNPAGALNDLLDVYLASRSVQRAGGADQPTRRSGVRAQ